jgi:CMP-N-acetylneuraminic acid synthetase
MNILGLIPARAGSKGIPNKNIRELVGKPLIAYTFRAASGSQNLTRVVLTTDSERIAALGREYGIEVPFVRPGSLAQDNTPMFCVIEHALDWLQTNQDYQPDVIVLLQPTAPLRTAKHIDASVELLHHSGADTVISVTPVPSHHHPAWQLVHHPDEGLCLYTGSSLRQVVTRRQDLSITFTRNGAVYAVRQHIIRQRHSLYGDCCIPYVMPPEESVNVDSLLDLKLAEILLQEQMMKEKK